MSATGDRARAWNLRELDVDGAPLGVAEAADGCDRDGRDAIVLLHGLTGSHASWTAVLEAWQPAARLIAPDLPGHGRSVPGWSAARCSIEAAAAALESMLDALAVARCSLVGYSMGGRLALYFALTRPRRVARLVLESASPGLATADQRQQRRRHDEALARHALEAGIEAFVERWQRTPVLADERDLPADVRAALRRQRLSCSAAGLAASLRGMGTGSQPWLGERLAEVAAPALVIAGARDHKFTALARSIAAGLGSAELAIVEDAGHNVHLARPRTFVGLLDAFCLARPPAGDEAQGPRRRPSAQGVNR